MADLTDPTAPSTPASSRSFGSGPAGLEAWTVRAGVWTATAAGAAAFGMLWEPWLVFPGAPSPAIDGFGNLPGGLGVSMPGIGLWHVLAGVCAVFTAVGCLVWLLTGAAVTARALPCVAAAGAVFALVSGLVMRSRERSALRGLIPGGYGPDAPSTTLDWGWGFTLCVVLLVVAAVAGAVVARGASASGKA